MATLHGSPYVTLGSRSGLPREHRARPHFERVQPLFEAPPRLLDRRVVCVGRYNERLADGERDGREGLRDLRAVPALQRPVTAGFEVERQHRIAGGLGEPDRARLRDARGPTTVVRTPNGNDYG